MVSDSSLVEIYTRRNSHKNTWDFFQVCLALSFWTIDKGPKIYENRPNGGLGHSWG